MLTSYLYLRPLPDYLRGPFHHPHLWASEPLVFLNGDLFAHRWLASSARADTFASDWPRCPA